MGSMEEQKRASVRGKWGFVRELTAVSVERCRRRTELLSLRQAARASSSHPSSPHPGLP